MERERIVDGSLMNVSLGAFAGLLGMTLTGGIASVIGNVMFDWGTGHVAAFGYGLLAGLAASPLTMTVGGAFAGWLRDRDLERAHLVAASAIGFFSVFLCAALFGGLVATATEPLIYVAGVIGAAGAAFSAWLYGAARRQEGWTRLIERVEPDLVAA